MRRRSTGIEVRERLAREYDHLSKMYDHIGPKPLTFADMAARIRAGDRIEVAGYQIDVPTETRVILEDDGSITPIV